ncbi:MAG TPA: class I SAM-dependent methyltransferase [Symbiobacteriaceae bacterium]|nr:class I SAM-dependent methyltransferase [Symbiobacteriaceae bacterium]
MGDISPAQLQLNRVKVAEAGWEVQVVGREVLDIVDLSRFPSAAFNAVVCYGGPLSYMFDRTEQALQELLRVTRPGGHLLLSVMSLVGSTRAGLGAALGFVGRFGLEAVSHVARTGDLDGSLNGHACRMFRWSELKAMLERQTCAIVGAAASGSLVPGQQLPAMEPVVWERFLEWELDYSQEPGAIDRGTHILAVVRKH